MQDPEQAAQLGRCGFANLAGRPNVGKSTLLNRLVGQKIAATTRRPQTTRNRLLGVVTEGQDQLILVDTPGIHSRGKRLLNQTLNQTAIRSLGEADLVLFMIVAGQWRDDDELILAHIRRAGKPVILVINKIDRLGKRADLLPFIDDVSRRFDFSEVVPVSARTGANVARLQTVATGWLPRNPRFFDPEQVTDQSVRFIAGELIREQVMERLGQELPYSAAVVVERFEEEGRLVRMWATVWVERESHRAIVIGAQGRKLKEIGSRSRQMLEPFLARRVYLQLWVKTKERWQDSRETIAAMGVDTD